jgi:DivIVA domain-containing protein
MPDKFNYVKRGYDPAEVDDYIDSLENVIKSYKEKDTAIKNALINAQLTADSIVKNAEIEVGQARGKAVAQLEKIFYSVQRLRGLVDRFKQDYNRLIETYIKEIDDCDFQPMLDQITKLEEYLESLKDVPYYGGDKT